MPMVPILVGIFVPAGGQGKGDIKTQTVVFQSKNLILFTNWLTLLLESSVAYEKGVCEASGRI